ncbi:MAG: sensor histidine kinase [Gammaproteobacteria bacterium]|nr:sensor histidine kinase [Gammaproteobacteria bacterium]MCW8971997.1 sensor histidine kinase [Gammaproteobacteria bacterium]
MKTSAPKPSEFFLPDFCGLHSVLTVVVLSELFALIFTLGAPGTSFDPWGQLALISLFMQWAGLSSAALLCASRRVLARLSNVAAALSAYFMLLLLILLLSEVAYRLAGDAGHVLYGTNHGEFLLRNLAIGAIVIALALRYLYVQHQWKQRIRAEAEARLQALQARIRPHFLFNSINTVTSLIHDRPDQAEEALLDLADLFRASMGEEQRRIPFADELALTRRYLHMETLRLGERLRVEWRVDTIPPQALIPPLILQPLVENAVYHGIEPHRQGGTITLAGHTRGNTLVLELSNPLPPQPAVHKGGNRLALDNIRERLQAHYGRQAALKIDENDGIYRVTLTLPLEVEA